MHKETQSRVEAHRQVESSRTHCCPEVTSLVILLEYKAAGLSLGRAGNRSLQGSVGYVKIAIELCSSLVAFGRHYTGRMGK